PNAARRSGRERKPGYNRRCRPGDRGRREALEESPDTEGQDAGATQAAKADGKWHRKETAGDGSRETSKVRVKRWGKSPPASWRHGGYPNPVRCKANRLRYQAARRGAGSAAQKDGHPRQNPAYRPATENPRRSGGFLFSGRRSGAQRKLAAGPRDLYLSCPLPFPCTGWI